jgi:hypothetical protein
VQGQLKLRGGAVEEAMEGTNATFERCEENIIALVSSPCLGQLALAKATAMAHALINNFALKDMRICKHHHHKIHLWATIRGISFPVMSALSQPQPVDTVTKQHQGNGETTTSSTKQGQHAQRTSEVPHWCHQMHG